jgi:hypothetical protein
VLGKPVLGIVFRWLKCLLTAKQQLARMTTSIGCLMPLHPCDCFLLAGYMRLSMTVRASGPHQELLQALLLHTAFLTRMCAWYSELRPPRLCKELETIFGAGFELQPCGAQLQAHSSSHSCWQFQIGQCAKGCRD